MIPSIKKQWFFFGLLFVFLLVVSDPTGLAVKTGIFFKNHKGPDVLIFLIFLISGLMIEARQIKAGIKDVKSTLTALLLIVILSPLIAGILSFLPFESGVVIGLFIVSVMPTTLSSGVVMTDKSGGNMAHALFVTILSNIVSIVTIPLILSFLLTLLNQEKVLTINQQAIVVKLLIIVLFPLLLGMGIKQVAFSISAALKQKLQVMNQLLVIFIVFMSLAGVRDILVQNVSIIWVIFPLVAGFHMVLLILAFVFIKLLNIRKGKFESVLFMGSQKTLPLSVMIQMTYFPEFGMALLVCVLHHIVHLMMDGYLCTKLK